MLTSSVSKVVHMSGDSRSCPEQAALKLCFAVVILTQFCTSISVLAFSLTWGLKGKL